MSAVEEMPLGRRSYLRCLLGEGHGRGARPVGGSGSLWVASTAVCLVPGVALQRTGSVPGWLWLETLAGGKVGIHREGAFCKGQGEPSLGSCLAQI